MRRLIALFVLVLTVTPALGQQSQLRTIEVPANATWEHAATTVRLPSRVAGATRGSIRDSTQQELDVIASYESHSEGLDVTVYVFKSGLPDVSLWFDRALTTIRLRPQFGLAEGFAPRIDSYSATSDGPEGLVTAIDLNAAQYRATAVLLLPLADGWLLKVRMTSSQLGAEPLRARLDTFMREVRLPAGAASGATPSAIQPCPQPLRLRRARVARPDMADALLGGLMGAATGLPRDRAVTYCREPGATQLSGVYRPDGSEDSYILALGDGGVALSLSPALTMADLQGGSSRSRAPVAMTLLDRTRTATWPSFDRLPPPEQALQALRETAPMVSATRN